MKKHIKMLAMDVDGTLTDGKIHISEQGELFKSFYVRDGYAIRHLLPQHGIIPVIITGRTSGIVEKRCEELEIPCLYQGISDKGACIRSVAKTLDIALGEAACIGDDENDLPMMEECGFCGCPADAVEAVKRRSGYICQAPGGHGAVREFIEWIIKDKN